MDLAKLRRKGIPLKTRMLFSHVAPLMIIIISVGFALTFLLETQVLLTRLNNELELQATLVAKMATENPTIWFNQRSATRFVDSMGEALSARIMLLNPDGVVLATSDPYALGEVGQQLDIPGLEDALALKQITILNKDTASGASEVLMPVVTSSKEVLGVIRLIDPLQSVYERFPLTRTLIIYVLTVGLAVGVIMASWLASDLSRPLQHATQSINQMAKGEQLKDVPEQGPREVRDLLHAFNTLTSELRSAERGRTRLLANLVHEIGRPLGALLSATQALEGGAYEEDEIRVELLEGMQSEIRRMQHLLDDLTRLYDQSSGRLILEPKPTELSPWLMQMLAPWRHAAQEKDITWDDHIPEDLPTLNIDKDRMAQAIGNIVSNAIKYTSKGGKITTETGQQEDVVWLSISDTGIGIPEEELDSVFEPFYRGSTSKRFPQGMGVGLSIARDLTEAHQGSISVQSEPGVGSTFTITLPLK